MTVHEQPAGQPHPESPSQPERADHFSPDLRYPAALYLLCLLIVVSPFGTWITLGFGHQSHSYTFDYRSSSPGWEYLLLAFATLMSITTALLTHDRYPRVIAASLLGASAIAAGTAIVQYAFFSAGAAPSTWTFGWGLWLCFASSLVGTVIAALWARKRPT
jgi:hypothetical protein